MPHSNRQTLSLCSLPLLAALAGPAQAQNLIVNGGFESPVTTAGSSTTLADGSTAITGWQVVGPNILLLNTGYTEPNLSFVAHGGQNSVDLTGAFNVGPTAGIRQTIVTEIGQTYRLSFWLANADGSGNSNYLLPSALSLSINDGPLQTFTNAATSTFTLNWQPYSVVFAASTTATMLTFLNATGLGDAEAGLDDVVVVSVPEPASALLAAGGLAGLLLYRRSRR